MPDLENIRGFNLEVVKLMTGQVINLPLLHKLRKIGMICFAKPGLTKDLYIVHNAICAIRTVDRGEAKPICKRQTHPLVGEDVI
jgi:hypothetical protein